MNYFDGEVDFPYRRNLVFEIEQQAVNNGRVSPDLRAGRLAAIAAEMAPTPPNATSETGTETTPVAPETSPLDSHLSTDPNILTEFAARTHKKISFGGFRYNRHRELKSGIVSYLCDDSRNFTPACKGRVYVLPNGTIEEKHGHCHNPDTMKDKLLKVSTIHTRLSLKFEFQVRQPNQNTWFYSTVSNIQLN